MLCGRNRNEEVGTGQTGRLHKALVFCGRLEYATKHEASFSHQLCFQTF